MKKNESHLNFGTLSPIAIFLATIFIFFAQKYIFQFTTSIFSVYLYYL